MLHDAAAASAPSSDYHMGVPEESQGDNHRVVMLSWESKNPLAKCTMPRGGTVIPWRSRRSPVGVPLESHGKLIGEVEYHDSTMGAPWKYQQSLTGVLQSHGRPMGVPLGVPWESHGNPIRAPEYHGNNTGAP